jgi:hypothetical protein
MTSTSLAISQQGSGPSAQDGVIFAHVGPLTADAYTPGQVLTFDPGQDVLTPCGPGMVCEFTAQQLAVNQKRTVVSGATKIPGAIGSVTANPAATGPMITVTSTDGTMGPADDYSILVKVLQGGAPGTAIVEAALDGASYDYAFQVPPELPGEVIGSIDLTGVTISSFDTETVVAHAEATSPLTVTFAAPVTMADLVSQYNTQAAAAGSHLKAALIQGRYFAIMSAILGPTSSLIVSSGTALAGLGITAATYAGSASIVNIPASNLKLTFPGTSSYVANVVYSCPVTGPRTSLAAILAACDALKSNFSTSPFNRIQIDATPTDETELLSWVNGLEAKLAAWQSADPKVFVIAHVPSPMYAGTGLGTSWSSTSGDQLVKNKLLGQVSDHVVVAHGDCFLTGQNVQGSFRRSSVQALGMMVGPNRLSADPGNATFGAVPQCSLKGPDFNAATGTGTLARDESTSTLKMGGSQGPGYTVLRNQSDGAHFVHGVTRAGSSSLFVDIGVLAATYYGAAIVDQLLHSIENVDFPLNPDGTMQDADAHSYNQAWTKTLNDFLVPTHFSFADVAIDNSKSMVTGPNQRTVIANYRFQVRGQGEFIKGSIAVVGTLNG